MDGYVRLVMICKITQVSIQVQKYTPFTVIQANADTHGYVQDIKISLLCSTSSSQNFTYIKTHLYNCIAQMLQYNFLLSIIGNATEKTSNWAKLCMQYWNPVYITQCNNESMLTGSKWKLA